MNFYRFLFGAKESIAEDAMVTRKHPDGSPCRAKSPESCPILRNAKKDDSIDRVKPVVENATAEEIDKISKGDDPGTRFSAVSVEQIPTMRDGETTSKYRKMRNEAYWKLKGKGDATYLLENPDEKVTDLTSGYMVSFQTTNGEGYNEENAPGLKMSDEEYDKTVDELKKLTGRPAYIGIFGGIPEVSFCAGSLKMAMSIARKYNQVSIANNKNISRDIWNKWTFRKNPQYDWKKNQTYQMKG